MWDWEFAADIFPRLLWMLRITIAATLAGMSLALVAGLVLALISRSDYVFVSLPTQWFVDFVRTTPLLVQLYFLYYVLPSFGVVLETYTTGIIGLGLHYGAYLSGVYRAGIDAVPKGQWDAAIALNFSGPRTWISVILPQAIKPMLPILGNYFISMFKDTPVLSAISIIEVLTTAKTIGTRSFRFIEPLTIVGVMYFCVSYPCAIVIRSLEKRYAQK